MSVVQDDEAELLAELARIRKEREQEAAKKAADEAMQKQATLQEEVIHGNPLFPRGQPDFQVRLSASEGHPSTKHTMAESA